MEKVNLNDVSFLLIVRLDSIERLENVLFVSNLLASHFDTHILLWEFAPCQNGILEKLLPQKVEYRFIEDFDSVLHRTRHLNEMIEFVQTPYVAVWDVDVISPIGQISKAVESLRGGCDFVYPYKDFFFDMTMEIRRWFLSTGDIDLLERYTEFMIPLYTPNPVGGAFFANRQKYIDSGKENENFYGWGHEDGERYSRWEALGYKIKRIEGAIYHLTHPRSINSLITHPNQTLLKKRELFNSIKKSQWKKICLDY